MLAETLAAEQIARGGYGLAALVFGALALLALTLWRNRARGSSILPVLAVSIVALLLLAIYPYLGARSASLPAYFAEFLFDLAWVTFLALEMRGSVAAGLARVTRLGAVALALLLLLVGILAALPGVSGGGTPFLTGILSWGSVLTSLAGLVGLNQLYRNTRRTQKSGLAYLVVGLGGLFAYDLVVFTGDVAFFADVSVWWQARGYIVAACAVLIGIALARVPVLGQGLFLSRRVVHFSSGIAAAAAYLAAVIALALYLRLPEGPWATIFKIVFVACALLVLGRLLLSDRVRGRARVFLDKHFFERKYDYRQEWLRLNETLTSSMETLPPRKRAIKSLAQLVDARRGRLWTLEQGAESFEPAAGWNEPAAEERIAGDDPLVQFFANTGWVLDLADRDAGPAESARLEHSAALASMPDDGLLIPLFFENRLAGLVALADISAPTALDFEDLDLLKTAGSQIAGYLAQQDSSERLAQARQFEAYSRFTAYVMHDLKNAVAQQSLVVDNADRHKRNPEFVDDAIDTIRGSVARMRRVLRTLQQQSVAENRQRVDLTRLIMQAETECDDRSPVPDVRVPPGSVVVLANRERLLMALCHAIRNSQDATPAEGSIRIELDTVDGNARLVIEDTGAGMDESFVRDRLFRPFDSTKGAEGMGIGAYQLRETIRTIGGDVTVRSVPGSGTRFELQIPLAPSAASAADG